MFNAKAEDSLLPAGVADRFLRGGTDLTRLRNLAERRYESVKPRLPAIALVLRNQNNTCRMCIAWSRMV
jgi:hypothetical protein